MHSLEAISPIDGRYRKKVVKLARFFSEEALIKYRIQIEILYFRALCKIPLSQLTDVSPIKLELLEEIIKNFTSQDAQRIKEIEQTTNHDVKAVEYFLQEVFATLDLQAYKEFIHFGLTSQDINNTAIPLALKEATAQVYIPTINELLKELKRLSEKWQNIPMLARTHGQPASPTKVGKEIAVFAERIEQQLQLLKQIPFAAKFGGATGNFNAHTVAYPNVDWKKFAQNFVEETLGLKHSFPTTQIEHYDHMAALFDAMKRINVILIDLNRDFWSYISMDYFKQEIKKGEIGSSAMPHKVNPIDFENSEGNLGMANALFQHFSAKLPVSRLQRDLTDSTVMRNIGVPISHTIIGINATLKGLSKLILNEAKTQLDLEENWSVVAEAIQTILRRDGFPNPYEALKELTRTNEKVTKKTIQKFIENLEISDEVKVELKKITPFNYTGI